MKIIEKINIDEAAGILRNGGLIAFPTETVFGLGVVYDNKDSYERLIQVKRRPPEKPFTMMCADPEDVYKYAELNDVSKKLVNRFMPGQFTLVTKGKKDLPAWCVSKEGTVGCRVPDMDVIRDLIRKVGKPLLVPSANKSGEIPANNSREVQIIFENELDAVIEGESNSKIPSTIVLVDENHFIMLREGIINKKQIQEALK